jgi:N-acetylgalactosamine-6-sulfatase
VRTACHAGNGSCVVGSNSARTDVRPLQSERIVDATIRFIEASKGKPFYVNVWLHDVHAPILPNEAQQQAYAKLTGPARVYYAAATDADKHIGRLLARLDDLGLADNTVVVFSTDNGPEDISIGNAAHSGVGSPGPFRGRKRSLYEGGVRVPFIVRWPGVVPAGRVDNTSVLGAVDFLPTVCALAGVPLPSGHRLDGTDIGQALRGTATPRAKPLFWEWRFRIFGHTLNKSPILAMRQGRWKLLMNPDKSRVELYDIPADPGETDNLADRHPDVVAAMSQPLLAWRAALPEGPMDPDAGSNAYPWPKAGTARS